MGGWASGWMGGWASGWMGGIPPTPTAVKLNSLAARKTYNSSASNTVTNININNNDNAFNARNNNQHPLSCALHTDTLDRGPLQLAIGFHNGGGAGGADEVERRRDVSRMSYWLAEMSSSGEMQNRYRQQVAGSW